MIKSYFNSLKLGFVFSTKQEDLKRYVQIGRVLSHLIWQIIGLRQINDKRIAIDMVYYVQRRGEEFAKHVGILEKMAKKE